MKEILLTEKEMVFLVLLYFYAKDFVIAGVIGSFLVVSHWQRRWHPSNANYTKGLSVGESNPIM